MENNNTIPYYQGTIAKKEKLSSKVYIITISYPQDVELTFTAGQFINIDMGNNVKRQYTIASSPFHKQQLELLIDVAPGGPGSHYFQNCKEGDMVSFSKPLGKFGLASESGEIVFLAASTGVAPFKSMIDYLIEKQRELSEKPQIYLFLSFRYQEDMFLTDYFKQIEQNNSNFHLTVTLSKPPVGWQGKSGYVQNFILNEMVENPTTHFYICGGNNMVQGSLEYLRSQNVPDNRTHFEQF